MALDDTVERLCWYLAVSQRERGRVIERLFSRHTEDPGDGDRATDDGHRSERGKQIRDLLERCVNFFE